MVCSGVRNISVRRLLGDTTTYHLEQTTRGVEIVRDTITTICEFWTTRDEGEEVVKNDSQVWLALLGGRWLHSLIHTATFEGEKGMWVGGMKV